MVRCMFNGVFGVWLECARVCLRVCLVCVQWCAFVGMVCVRCVLGVYLV